MVCCLLTACCAVLASKTSKLGLIFVHGIAVPESINHLSFRWNLHTSNGEFVCLFSILVSALYEAWMQLTCSHCVSSKYAIQLSLFFFIDFFLSGLSPFWSIDWQPFHQYSILCRWYILCIFFLLPYMLVADVGLQTQRENSKKFKVGRIFFVIKNLIFIETRLLRPLHSSAKDMWDISVAEWCTVEKKKFLFE